MNGHFKFLKSSRKFCTSLNSKSYRSKTLMLSVSFSLTQILIFSKVYSFPFQGPLSASILGLFFFMGLHKQSGRDHVISKKYSSNFKAASSDLKWPQYLLTIQMTILVHLQSVGPNWIVTKLSTSHFTRLLTLTDSHSLFPITLYS